MKMFGDEKVNKYKFNDFGIRICSLCHRPINDGTQLHLDIHLGYVHSFCLENREKAQPKHDPDCDCGVCTFCDGQEDVYGNKKLAEPQTALKIRFVLLENAIVLQVLALNQTLLGVGEGTKRWKNTDFYIYADGEESDLCFDESKIALHSTGTAIRSLFDGDQKDLFETCIQPALIEFAKNNAFHGTEKKPESYVEELKGGEFNGMFRFHYYRSYETVCSIVVKTIEEVTGKPFPIYSPKPMFTHEWRKISPRELTANDLPSLIPVENQTEFELLRDFAANIHPLTKTILAKVNELQKDLPEIWEFEMLTNG